MFTCKYEYVRVGELLGHIYSAKHRTKTRARLTVSDPQRVALVATTAVAARICPCTRTIISRGPANGCCASYYIWSFPRPWATAGTMCSTNSSQEYLVKPSKNGMIDERSYILQQQQQVLVCSILLLCLIIN